MVKRCFIAAALVLIVTSCDSAEPPQRRAIVDTLSTGAIRVRGPDGGAWSDADRWQLEEQLRLGRIEGEGPDVFGQIWAISAGVDGHLYVLDRLAKEIRVFDRRGGHVRTLGRPGSGPGEFVDPFGLAWQGPDKLWVVDVAQARYSVFDSSGAHLAEFPRRVGGFSWPWPGRFDRTGKLYEASYFAGGVRPITAFELTANDLVARDTFTQALASQQPGDFWNLQDDQGIGAVVGVPFGRKSEWALDPGGELWIGHSAEYSIALQSLNGDTIVLIESSATPYPVSNSERDAAIEGLGDYTRHPKMDLSRIPQTKPFFQRLLPDPSGNLWVLREGADDKWFFDVFAHDGTYLGEVHLSVEPELFPPPWIGDEMLLAVTKDEFDVQSLAVFRIKKGQVARGQG